MLDPGFIKFLANPVKSVLFIKSHLVRLSIQKNPVVFSRIAVLKRITEQGMPQSKTAIRQEYGDPTDFQPAVLRIKTGGSRWNSVYSDENVRCDIVQSVPFLFHRNVLLLDKNFPANITRRLKRRRAGRKMGKSYRRTGGRGVSHCSFPLIGVFPGKIRSISSRTVRTECLSSLPPYG